MSPGDRLGPYEIVGPLDAGGMGQVYRARDPRLRRDVALKVLHSHIAATPEHVERLGREARAAGGLNHPNIVAVFDVGTQGGAPYVVSELLEGESLRHRLQRGALSYRDGLEYGIQIAQALGAAHAKGICHRDVKPENVFVMHGRRVKLLDFGLAKLERRKADPDDSTADHTQPGAVHGTFGYMSPEQALGEPVDERTDLFSLGAVLYEMFTGARAFRRGSAVETVRAVLKEEPTDPREIKPSLPRPAAEVVRRCLEKNREERFQSARDLAFQLQQLLEAAVAPPSGSAVRGRHRRWWLAAALAPAAVAAGAVTAGWWLGSDPPTFEQLTFSRGRIGGARFASHGEAVVYSQAVPGQSSSVPEVWWKLRDSAEARPLGYAPADVLAAHGGKLALSMRPRFAGNQRFVGTFAEAPLGGGAPREKRENVEAADWDSSGTALAVAYSVGTGGRSRIEYPEGSLLYDVAGSVRNLRISPDGRHVAFLEGPSGVDTRGRVALVDRDRQHRFLTPEWPNAKGLAWSPRGDEVWFTAGKGPVNRALYAVDLEGRQRVIHEAPGSLTLWDTAADGRVLLARDEERRAIIGVPPGQTRERDLSWFDSAGLADLSDDGRTILFSDRFGIYVRPTDGRPPTYLGLQEGWADDLSPDGQQVLATTSSASRLVILSIKGGEAPRPLPAGNIVRYGGALWFPDQRRILVSGYEAGREPRSYVQDLPDGLPRALTPENTWALSVSGNGEWAATTGPNGGIALWPVTEGRQSRQVPGSDAGDRPAAFSQDGLSLWVWRRNEVPARVYQVELETGRRHLWKTLVPPDPAGVFSIIWLKITPAGDAYFYGYARVLSELYLVSGLR